MYYILHDFSGTSLGHICFHVESVKRNVAAHKESPVLPEYSCLLLSPANLWQQDIERFLLDANILTTVFNHQVIIYTVCNMKVTECKHCLICTFRICKRARCPWPKWCSVCI